MLRILFIFTLGISMVINLDAQEKIPYDMEILTQTTHCISDDTTKFVISPIGTTWNFDDSWYIDDIASQHNQIIVGNHFGTNDEYGFDICYDIDTDFDYGVFWMGLNKITIYHKKSGDSSFTKKIAFYIDYRNCDLTNGPDITIRYDFDSSNKIYVDNNLEANASEDELDEFDIVDNGEIKRIWEIKPYYDVTATNCIPNYWQNCLVLLEKNNHPRLVWGPHPNSAISYKLYRGKLVQLPTPHYEYELIATLDNDTYDYVDTEEMIPENPHKKIIFAQIC